MANRRDYALSARVLGTILLRAAGRGLLGPRAQGVYLAVAAALTFSELQPTGLTIDPADTGAFCSSQGFSNEKVLP